MKIYGILAVVNCVLTIVLSAIGAAMNRLGECLEDRNLVFLGIVVTILCACYCARKATKND